MNRNSLYAKTYTHNLRLEVLDKYGGKCVCCGETNNYFLCLDHVNNDGKQHRQELKELGTNILHWIIRNNYPDSIQLLCFNCNMGKQLNGGVCPHITNTVKIRREIEPSPRKIKPISEKYPLVCQYLEDTFVVTGRFPKQDEVSSKFDIDKRIVSALIKEIYSRKIDI